MDLAFPSRALRYTVAGEPTVDRIQPSYTKHILTLCAEGIARTPGGSNSKSPQDLTTLPHLYEGAQFS